MVPRRTPGLLAQTFLIAVLAAGGLPSRELQAATAPAAVSIPQAAVALGQAGVFDGSPMVAAQQLGYFKDVGLTVTIKPFGDIQGIGEATAAGSLNAGLFGDQGGIPAIGNLGKMTFCTFGDVFEGYAIMGRKGKNLTFQDALAQAHGDKQKAIELTMQGLKGKTLITQFRTGMEGFLRIALAKAHMDVSDLKIIQLSSPEGATAFLRGDGDLQLGDVPSRYRVEEEGAVPVITAAQVGPPALLFVGYVCNSAWLAGNPDTMLRVLSVWYRIADRLRSDPDPALTTMYQWVNQNAGTSFDLTQAKFIQKEISPWLTFEEAGRTFYDAAATTYVGKRLAYVIQFQQDAGNIPKGKLTTQSASMAEDLYRRLKAYRIQADANLAKLAGLEAHVSGAAKQSVDALTARAKTYYADRDYLDAARFSDAAVSAAQAK